MRFPKAMAGRGGGRWIPCLPHPRRPAAPGSATGSRLTPFSRPGSRGVFPPHSPTPIPGAEDAASSYKSRRLRVCRARRRRLLPFRGQAAAAVPRGSAVGRPEGEPEAPIWAWDWLFSASLCCPRSDGRLIWEWEGGDRVQETSQMS